MNVSMQTAQSDVVNAFLDAIGESGHDEGVSVQHSSGWEQLVVHAEYAEMGGAIAHYTDSTALAQRGNEIIMLPLPITDQTQDAIDRLRVAYVEAGHDFWRFDLTIEADWRYRFTFDQTPSLVLAGQTDPEVPGRMKRVAAEYAKSRGLQFHAR